MSDDIEQMITTFRAGLRGKPNYAYNLAGLAEVVAHKKVPLRALEVAREALAAAGDDPRAATRARRLMAGLIPGYHVPMMNDARRNETWDRALRRAIRPGMHVLEIGTGAGMLALMAARAGATVTTCDTQPVVAQLARELVVRNGLAERITVLTRSSRELQPADLPRPADLLFCDIFGDNLFDFEPLPLIADAQARLLASGAPVLPRAVSLQVALGWSPDLRNTVRDTCGFDLSPMRDFVSAAHILRIGDPDIRLLSQPQQAFRFDFTGSSQRGEIELGLQAEQDCEVNGAIYWIKLELDDENVLEARPEPGLRFFSSPSFAPFAVPQTLKAGDAVRIGVAHRGKVLETWIAGHG
ncbi:MAG: 50S ribosomal protein L11 methyltransferase [Alphaproteobacteria bacterium]|nr:50S ribosomal protein L11 methyltransferase [Alphaproteobacteria bacterium]MBL6939263.1 50S ribosomal protein L11 methyltransferase [Alphaproteobacteria bacterium]MBL7096779.1 50S ribosomal protein L11 methyltransferase [Alphaproteobacteria bacterium]